MKKLIAVLVFLFSMGYGYGQQGNTLSQLFNGVPTGTCAFIQQAFDTTTGVHYDCNPLTGTWRVMATGAVVFPTLNQVLDPTANREFDLSTFELRFDTLAGNGFVGLALLQPGIGSGYQGVAIIGTPLEVADLYNNAATPGDLSAVDIVGVDYDGHAANPAAMIGLNIRANTADSGSVAKSYGIRQLAGSNALNNMNMLGDRTGIGADPGAGIDFDVSSSAPNGGAVRIGGLTAGGLVGTDTSGNLMNVAPSPSQGSALLSGCGVFYSVSALTAQVASCNYTIAGVSYSLASAPVTVTFGANASGSPRIDVVVVNTSSGAAVVAGTAATNPGVPSIDPTTQIVVGQVLIANGASAPSVTNELVYDEDTGPASEWTTSVSGASIVANSTANPFNGTKNIQGTTVATGAFFKFVRGSGTVNIVGDIINFYLDPNAVAWAKQKGLTIATYSGSTLVGSAVTLNNGAFAFNTATNAYQQVTIAGNAFNTGGTPIDTFLFTITGGGASIPSFSFDWFNIQAGATTPPPLNKSHIYTCMIVVGADNAASVLVDADLGPQGQRCTLPQGGTVQEIRVDADSTGTPNVIVRKKAANGTTYTNLLSGALATSGTSNNNVACASLNVSFFDGSTKSGSIAIVTAAGANTLAPGESLGLTSGTAGGVSKRMSISIYFTTPQ